MKLRGIFVGARSKLDVTRADDGCFTFGLWNDNNEILSPAPRLDRAEARRLAKWLLAHLEQDASEASSAERG